MLRWAAETFPPFQGIAVPSYSGASRPGITDILPLDAADEGITIFRNVRIPSLSDKASRPRGV